MAPVVDPHEPRRLAAARRFFSPGPRTLAFEPRDYPEWHRGRDRYAVWLIDADLAPLRDRVARARAHLGGLLADAQRQPHVTVFVCGFLAEAATWNDDFTPAMLARQRQALARAGVGPFELEVGGLASFDSAAFLDVRDPDGCLAPLRAALAAGRDEVCREEAYVPHLTVGLYRDAFVKDEVARRLAGFADDAPVRLPVRRIDLAVYPARDHGGLLERRESFVLGAGG